MPHLIFTPSGLAGLDRCRRFLSERNPQASERASLEILRRLTMLERFPRLGRPYRGSSEMRELSISFGRGGYLALYRHDREADAVYLIDFCHQREAGYGD